MNYQVKYEELPEVLFKESKTYDATRREITLLVELAKEYGFNSYSNVGEYHLKHFFENILSRVAMAESTEGIDINKLSDRIFLLTGHSCKDAQDTINYSLKLIERLADIADTFSGPLIKLYTEVKEDEN